MFALLPMLAKLWRPALLSALVGAAFLYRGVLVHERDSARRQTGQLETRIADLMASNSQFEAAVRDCNAQVSALQLKAGALERAAAGQAAQAAQRASDIRTGVAREAAALTTARIGPQCEAAIAWANRQGPELGRW